jgi:hypothetical protein
LGTEYKGRTDRQRAIDWLREDLSHYRLNLGETTEFGTVIDIKLIKAVENRIEELEKKEYANKWRLPELA